MTIWIPIGRLRHGRLAPAQWHWRSAPIVMSAGQARVPARDDRHHGRLDSGSRHAGGRHERSSAERRWTPTPRDKRAGGRGARSFTPNSVSCRIERRPHGQHRGVRRLDRPRAPFRPDSSSGSSRSGVDAPSWCREWRDAWDLVQTLLHGLVAIPTSIIVVVARETMEQAQTGSLGATRRGRACYSP